MRAHSTHPRRMSNASNCTPMTTPQISGKYQFQIDLKGLCLPVTFTIPDIPDVPPVVTDNETTIIETDSMAQPEHADIPAIAQQHQTVVPRMQSMCGDMPDANGQDQANRDLLSDLGITVHHETIRNKQIKFRWFNLQGTTVPLNSPSSIQGLDGLRTAFQLFDIFVHAYHPATGSSSNECTLQLWIWEPQLSGGFSWKPVTVGYVCPGPGELQGRHLVIRGRGKPLWVTGSTRYRRYKEVHSTSAPLPGNCPDDETTAFEAASRTHS
ncbi:hypothetical protein BC826DRAFT_481228 [Russula brevipes]|nr:hypothetical protein BC826DRAFT_481228 [Russula brevipes]